MKGTNLTILSVFVLLMAAGLGIGCTTINGNGHLFEITEAPDFAEINFVKSGEESLVRPKKPKWVVSDSDPKLSGTYIAQGGTLYIFAPESTAIELQFPMNYNSVFRDVNIELEENDTYRKYVAAGDTLTLNVKKNAPSGVYEYAVLIIEDCILAIGDSVPTIKVPR